MSNYSVVIVAHNRARQLLNALVALRKFGQPTEVVLVDNSSESDLGGIARLSQLPIRQLRLPDHQSLGAAFNAGLDAARFDRLLLMHSDVVLESDPVVGIEFLEQNPDVGIVGAKLFRDGTDERVLMHVGYQVGRGRIAPTSIGRHEQDTFDNVCDVAAVSDACMLARRGDIRFDERFWFRLQDVDLCFQYRQAGYRVVVGPWFQARHLENGGVAEYSGDTLWATRHLASQWLYHHRWCSDSSLAEHPLQVAVRGDAARDYLRECSPRNLSG
jgi:GT2 family glycosyltransferase